MPYVSDEQRRFMHWAHPQIAARWDREAKHAPPPARQARQFPGLTGLVGISDKTIADHLRLYERAVAELGSIQSAYPRTAWTAPADLPVPTAEVQQLLDSPVRLLPLHDPARWPPETQADSWDDSVIGTALSQLRGELLAKGISWFPSFYLGEAEFWTADQAVSINLPWYLGSDVLWQIVNSQTDRYTPEELMMVLRHEAAHALNYAFELWRSPAWGLLWEETFGDFLAPYRDEFPVDPISTDYVRHLHRSGAAANLHYAQKHPDEDWAETFATWLDPGSRWRDEYAAWPGALAKLEAVDHMAAGLTGEPTNTRVGRRAPWFTLDYTVGQFLGTRTPGEFSPHSALLRREPEVLASVVLHELYFEQLSRGAGLLGRAGIDLGLVGGRDALAAAVSPGMRGAVLGAFGSWESYLTDLRAIGGSTDGWALTVWDPAEGRVRNALVTGHANGVPPGCPVLLAVDLHEHAFAEDYGIRKDLYLGALFRNVDWAVVEGRLQKANPPPVSLPTIGEALYAPPNPDGSRKSCGNCYLMCGGSTTRCSVHDVPVSPDMVCGYHLFGEPVPMGIQLPVLPIAPELSGLATIPGGTSCGGCRFFGPTAYGPPGTSLGSCAGIAGQPTVDAGGCCARWEAVVVSPSEPGPPPAVDPDLEGQAPAGGPPRPGP